MILIAFLIFIIGICVGSFLNVLVDRLPREETIFVGRSHCDFCHRPLAWYDMFPLFSFLVLAGKCRYCHKFIGWKYPLIEFTTGIVFASMPFLIPLSNIALFLIFLGICCCFIVIFYTDLFSGIIPDSMVVGLFVLTIIKIVITHQSFLISGITGIICGLFFLLLHILTRGRGMGLGDVKYALVMGFLLGFPISIVGFYIAFLTGAVLSLILVVTKKKSFGGSVSFGPFLIFGTIVTLFWGSALWNLFLHLLNL